MTVKHFNDRYLTGCHAGNRQSNKSYSNCSGMPVNLERAMSANGRFGGHIVSGHVDGMATIQRKGPVANAVYIDLAMEKHLSS